MTILKITCNPILELYLQKHSIDYWKFFMDKRLESFKLKISKTINWFKGKPGPKYSQYRVLIINLSSHQLTDKKYQ